MNEQPTREYITRKEFDEQLLKQEKTNGQMFANIERLTAQNASLLRIQTWFMGIVSTVLVGLIVALAGVILQ
ncbi:MAG: hypothetical protein E7491_05780 [Ruminococcaceae bacterium]|nr:hypothetical protein [Oscillospiraceae bacterium]